MPILRQDPLTGEWVIIATERARRPETFASKVEEREAPPPRVDSCPFCPGNEHQTPSEVLVYRKNGKNSEGAGKGVGELYLDDTDWDVRVIPNKFPALERDPNAPRKMPSSRCELFLSHQGYGVHEVIIETPWHNRHLAELSVREVEMVLRSFQERTKALARDVQLRYVQIFRNHKKEAGASIEHPHCQLLALSYIPPLLNKEYARSHDFYLEEGRCLLCSLIEMEEASGQRVVLQNDRYIAYIPFAAPLPFSAIIAPREHYSSLEVSPAGWEKDLAPLLKRFLGILAEKLEDPPYNFYLHVAPLRTPPLAYFHWHLEIIPKLTVVAGWEMATGTFINVTRPEEAADYLRMPRKEMAGALKS
ncbi:MAG TPA: galactose-1-phosphate uridylyltransferase [Firmicutes bacterium]|jgi:UDPglucose--hexose-1-phosphate uridylyltransferase|nr:galactose-1-phosphate uridylyltransferase [Bacillota bacterium]